MQHQNSALPVLVKVGNLVVRGLRNCFVGRAGIRVKEVFVKDENGVAGA